MSLMTSAPPASEKSFDRYAAEASMAWYGWGSPVGLGIMLVALGVCAALVRFAVLGH